MRYKAIIVLTNSRCRTLISITVHNVITISSHDTFHVIDTRGCVCTLQGAAYMWPYHVTTKYSFPFLLNAVCGRTFHFHT